MYSIEFVDHDNDDKNYMWLRWQNIFAPEQSNYFYENLKFLRTINGLEHDWDKV